MKFLVFLAALIGLAFGQFGNYRPTFRQTGREKDSIILKSNFDLGPNGNYQYGYETENGITGQESGFPRNLGGFPPAVAETAQGTFSWTSPEGQYISIGYTADENGYHPVGDALPTPPPIPLAILRSIEYNKAKAAQRGFNNF
ncbi:larval cuticle protein LCP-22-like [Arctopsyche grandis]|uniref:larval cuticle protein LCP-22-like n=1 Tax=Arctopsyche grandis TaxID=121162 RepID=UPI00406D6D8F